MTNTVYIGSVHSYMIHSAKGGFVGVLYQNTRYILLEKSFSVQYLCVNDGEG